MKTQFNEKHRALCEVRLGELSSVDIANLTEFAERRLAAKGLNPLAGEDVTQRALVAILRGLESGQSGRVPRWQDIENKDTFLNYARGAISSISQAMGRKRQFRTEHKQWQDDNGPSKDATVSLPSKDAELNDLRDQLFVRLRARAPKRLRRTIDAWEMVFTESDRIPARGHRRYVREVKALAKDIISELGGIQ